MFNVSKATPEELEIVKRNVQEYAMVHFKHGLDWGMALAMPSFVLFVSGVLESAKASDEKLLDLIIASLNVSMEQEGMGLILVSKPNEKRG